MKEGVIVLDPSKFEPNDLCGIYADIANLLGVDATRTLHAAYHGQQISFPVHFYSREFIEKLIVAEYDGSNIKQLATKFNYSEKWIRNIITKSKGDI